MREHVRLLGYLTPVPECALRELGPVALSEQRVPLSQATRPLPLGECALCEQGPTLTAPLPRHLPLLSPSPLPLDLEKDQKAK